MSIKIRGYGESKFSKSFKNEFITLVPYIVFISKFMLVSFEDTKFDHEE